MRWNPLDPDIPQNYSKNNLNSNRLAKAGKFTAEARLLNISVAEIAQHRVRYQSSQHIPESKENTTTQSSNFETQSAMMATQTKDGHVAVCFFGQVKHYKQVAASQQKYVFDILRASNFTYDIFAHTYNQTEFSNPRNGVKRSVEIVPTSLQQILSLPNSAVLYDSPEAADQLFNVRNLAKNGDPWPDNPLLSIKYFTRQLHSLKRVTQLWTPAMHKYEFVLYLRPDVLFISPLDLPLNAPALRAKALRVATPNWHQFGGLNDRLAYGAPAAMAAYGVRGDGLQRFVDSGGLPHAERFLKRYLASQGVASIASRTKFQRVRADGHVDGRDAPLSKPGRH
jgi:hypothetical protein